MYSSSINYNIAKMDAVFTHIEDSNLKVSFSKNYMADLEVFVFGHTVSAAVRRPHLYHIETIAQKRPISSDKEVRHFFGALSFYRRFILES